jgi:transcription elongation GreA/GreB family factor
MADETISRSQVAPPNQGAGVGSTVRVAGEAGRMIEFELVARRHHQPRGLEVTPTSPVGELLMGARAGDVVRVRLPSGRDRVLRVLDVCSAGLERCR